MSKERFIDRVKKIDREFGNSDGSLYWKAHEKLLSVRSPDSFSFGEDGFDPPELEKEFLSIYRSFFVPNTGESYAQAKELAPKYGIKVVGVKKEALIRQVKAAIEAEGR